MATYIPHDKSKETTLKPTQQSHFTVSFYYHSLALLVKVFNQVTSDSEAWSDSQSNLV